MRRMVTPGGWLYRVAPSAVAAVGFLGFALLWIEAPAIYFAVMSHFGFPLLSPPMADTYSVIQAISCWQAGVNVYAPSPCMGGGVYNYSPFLLHLGVLFPLPRNGFTVGAVLDILFIASLCWLPPAQTRAELLLRIAAICSSSMLFVLEPANIDAAMFVLAVLGIMLIRINTVIGVVGYAVFAFGAACKFYPVALLLLVWRERPRRLLLLAVPGLLALTIYISKFGGGSLVALRILPCGLPYADLFGALNLPFGTWLLVATHTLSPNLAQYTAAISHPSLGIGIQIFVELSALVLLIVALRMAPRWDRAFAELEEEHRLFLTGGAAVMLICFFLAQNLSHRAIFLLLVLPGLCRMAAAGAPWMRSACAAILYLLWQDAFQGGLRSLTSAWPAHLAVAANFLLWFMNQLIWWGCVFLLMSMIVCFLKLQLRAWRQPAMAGA